MTDSASIPEGIELTRDLGTLRITFPGGMSLSQTPVPQSGGRIFAALVAIASPIGLWSAVGMLANMGGSAAVLARPWFLVFSVVATVVNIGVGLFILKAQKLSVKTAAHTQVELRPHSLWIHSDGHAENILLERIEKVTTDAAGARMWVDGRNRYLLPDRSEAERTWLAGLIREAITTRQHVSPAEADQERARLEALLQRT
ncbi:MAG: hypothetical protein ACI8RZ_004503 [Myxococcota bacterium]|jgi:hypothetical protein